MTAGETTAKSGEGAAATGKSGWTSIGTVVGNTTTDRYSFILRSYQAKLGDIVATRTLVPEGGSGSRATVTVWGRVVSIGRFNPFFPAEAAQELAEQNIQLLNTVLSSSRDHLEAEVLILGATRDDGREPELSPLTYPVQPSADVLYPPAADVKALLTGEETRKKPLRIGSLIARRDVEVSLSARHVVSRHLAILAMTGGGKTVAARRIIRELIDVGYPLVIFDPHGDYLGLFEKKALFPNSTVRILYPVIRIQEGNVGIISDLIDKMGRRLTEAQQQLYHYLVATTNYDEGIAAREYIDALYEHGEAIKRNMTQKKGVPDELQNLRANTAIAVLRSLDFVRRNLLQMEQNNERLRRRFKDREGSFVFEEMPDPWSEPERIVRPNQVSIFYLAGYDHLNQSAIVSIVLESLFAHRATLSDEIPPFQAVIEEAHNFIPSRQEGTDETPSLVTIRKVITEGRKFGTGLILISQRPSRLDETTLAQCNSFLVLRLVNPKDKSFVRSVMENLSETDANILQTFGPGQGIVSGQAVKFPLLVKIAYDEDLKSEVIGDEDFFGDVQRWKPPAQQVKKQANTAAVERFVAKRQSGADAAGQTPEGDRGKRGRRAPQRGRSRPKRLRPEGY